MTIKPVAWTELRELAGVINDEIGSMWGGKESDDQIALCFHAEATAEIERLKGENKRLREALKLSANYIEGRSKHD